MSDVNIEPQPGGAAKTRLLSGSLWMLAMRWVVRLSGLVSTIVLARLLVPEDFGIIAMAKIGMGLLEALATVGVDLAIIRHRNPSRDVYDTAWTIRLLQRVVLAVILFLAAPLLAGYFEEPRTIWVVRMLAVAMLARGFLNIGVVEFRRSLNFRREFQLGVLEKLVSVIGTIALALILRNYWALALSIPLEAIAGVVLSYIMHPYRPRISVAKFRSIWSFSVWLLVSRVGFFFNRRLDQILVGGNFDTGSMGYYNFSADLGQMPGNELAVPVRRAIFPNLAALLAERRRFDQTILKVVGVAALVLAPIGFGLASVASTIFPLVFGEKWSPAIPMFQWLAVAGVFSGLSGILEIPLLVNGREKLSALESWLRTLVTFFALMFALQFESLEVVAGARTLVAAAFFILMTWFCTFACGLTVADIVKGVWRSFFGAISLHLVLRFEWFGSLDSAVGRLMSEVALGALTYVFVVVALWLVSGRPDGPEKSIAEQIMRRRRTISSPDEK